jgi:hypothetical protein
MRGRDALKEFIADGNAYLVCLAEQELDMGEEIDPEQGSAILAHHNRMVDEMRDVAERFNKELRIFREQASR